MALTKNMSLPLVRTHYHRFYPLKSNDGANCNRCNKVSEDQVTDMGFNCQCNSCNSLSEIGQSIFVVSVTGVTVSQNIKPVKKNHHVGVTVVTASQKLEWYYLDLFGVDLFGVTES